jgi:hypothetical protein
MTTRGTVSRAALAAALLVLAGILIWIGVTRFTTGATGTEYLLGSALLPLAAAGLLFRRRGMGAGLAVVAALLGALVGVGLSFCLCSAPLKTESIALLVASLAVFVLALVELLTLRLAWVAAAIVIGVFVLLFPGYWSIFAVGLVIVGLVVWLLIRRRGSGSGA